MAILVLDPILEERIKADRGENPRDEVWDGVLVMSPVANLEHQDLTSDLIIIIRAILGSREAGRIQGPTNVSDRDEGWTENYREPDVAVYLPGNPARDCGTHWVGGPDLAIEILSPGDRARDKGPFYAGVGVREFLVIDRDPWGLELYRPDGGQMKLVAKATPGGAGSIGLGVLPMTLRLVEGAGRPSIEVAHESDGRRWTI